MKQMKNYKDWTGHKYSNINIIGFDKRENKHLYWKALCICGNEFSVRTDQLPNKIKSCGCLNKLEAGKAALNKLYGHYKRSAKSRNYPFNLTLIQFTEITSKVCFYCGSTPTQTRVTERMNGAVIYNGIDRYDNSLGYEYNNCVPCCGFCNRAKFNKTAKEFNFWITQLVNFVNTKG